MGTPDASLAGKARGRSLTGFGEHYARGRHGVFGTIRAGAGARHGVLGLLQGSAAMRRKRKCLARTRRGTPCQCKALRTKRGAWRCRLHGGLSTGPKTPEGRARIAEAMRRRWNALRVSKKTKRPAPKRDGPLGSFRSRHPGVTPGMPEASVESDKVQMPLDNIMITGVGEKSLMRNSWADGQVQMPSAPPNPLYSRVTIELRWRLRRDLNPHAI